MKYTITLAQLTYGNIQIEAESREKAKEKALAMAAKDCNSIDWSENKSYQVAEVYREEGFNHNAHNI